MRALLRVLLFSVLLSLPATRAEALGHVVQPGDTLAALAERYYGRIQYERILVAANRLDLGGGTPLVPGMNLLIPTVSYITIGKKETWANLAKKYLGSAERADVLSIANGSSPWLVPEEAARVLIPYALAVLLTQDESIVTIAQKYLGDGKHAWMLTRYNNFKQGQIPRGTVVLIPLTELELASAATPESSDPERVGLDALANARRQQRRIAAEIPALLADVRSGRYVDAVARANRFLASELLTVPQQTLVLRQLVEAYTALDATGQASAACSEWRKLDPRVRLDPAEYSPKVLKVCGVQAQP